MRPPTLIVNPRFPHIETSWSDGARETPTGYQYCVCDGDLGISPSIVLPVATGQLDFSGPYRATSMCDGTSMGNQWWWHGRVIQTSASTRLDYNSWIYVANYASNTSTVLRGVLFTPPKPRPRQVSAAIHAGRRALRRSIDIYSRFRDIDEVRRFIRGEGVIYEGEQYNYQVKRTMKVLEQTMNPTWNLHPYSFHAIDKRTKKEVARGCISISGLPVLDQLLALSFYIQDPKDEQTLLKATNWTPRLPQRQLLQEAA